MLSAPFPSPPPIHVQYCDVLHNRHHKVSQSLPFFMHCKTVTILARGIHAQKPKQASVHSLKSQRNPKGMHSIFESVFCPISLRIRVRGHFVMSITKNHESHYATVLDSPPPPFHPNNKETNKKKRKNARCLDFKWMNLSFHPRSDNNLLWSKRFI